jgi:hypothetical protein
MTAGRCHIGRQLATLSDGTNAPYKRGVIGSIPIAPTKFPQVNKPCVDFDRSFAELIRANRKIFGPYKGPSGVSARDRVFRGNVYEDALMFVMGPILQGVQRMPLVLLRRYGP